MANQHYAEFPERKAVAGGGKPPPTGSQGGSGMPIVARSASWGLHGAPTQKGNRHPGVREVRQYAKAEGLMTYDPALNYQTTGKFFGGQLGPNPFGTPLTPEIAPAFAPKVAGVAPGISVGMMGMGFKNKRDYGTWMKPRANPPEGSVDDPQWQTGRSGI